MKVKIKNITIVTPLGNISLINKEESQAILSSEEYNKMMCEWNEVLTKMKYFKFPDDSGRCYVLPQNVLQNSYVYGETEEIKQ